MARPEPMDSLEILEANIRAALEDGCSVQELQELILIVASQMPESKLETP